MTLTIPTLTTDEAATAIAEGQIIITPTEAVFGLSCDPQNSQAVDALLQLKKRAWQKGLILIATDLSQVEKYIEPLSNDKLATVNAVWPGPVTYLLPAKAETPTLLKGQFESIAVRLTAHKAMRHLIDECGHALVSTSANINTEPAVQNLCELSRSIAEGVAGCLEGELGGNDKPSQIIDLASGRLVR